MFALRTASKFMNVYKLRIISIYNCLMKRICILTSEFGFSSIHVLVQQPQEN